MSRMKISINFKGFEEYAEKLEGLGGDLRAAVDEALTESYEYVTRNLEADMKKHYLTGETERSILRDSKVEWNGNIGEIKVGFDIKNRGLPSVFLMYGTPRHAPGHPGTTADKQLYDDVYGSSTKRKISKIQKDIFEKALRRRMGG